MGGEVIDEYPLAGGAIFAFYEVILLFGLTYVGPEGTVLELGLVLLDLLLLYLGRLLSDPPLLSLLESVLGNGLARRPLLFDLWLLVLQFHVVYLPV